MGGNIPCNTIPAFEASLKQGADMIEIDIEMSMDGKLYVFHPGKERDHLFFNGSLRRMTSDEIAGLRYANYDNLSTQFPINTLEEVLETFKGRCFINVDKFWSHPKEIYDTIKRYGMIDQTIVKSSPTDKGFEILKELAPDIPYFAVVSGSHPLHEVLMNSNVNYVGVEVNFKQEDSEVASHEFIEKMHHDGKLVWANAIVFDYKRQLAAGHSDDTAICGDPEKGWGWLARRGFDLIQTDWTGMLVQYLKEQDLYYKK